MAGTRIILFTRDFLLLEQWQFAEEERVASWHLLRWEEERGGLGGRKGPILPSETLPSAVMEEMKEEVVVDMDMDMETEMGGDMLKVEASLVLLEFEGWVEELGFDLRKVGFAKSRVSVWG